MVETDNEPLNDKSQQVQVIPALDLNNDKKMLFAVNKSNHVLTICKYNGNLTLEKYLSGIHANQKIKAIISRL